MEHAKSKYPNTFYRVTVKAIIRDEHGRVLVVKEDSDAWSLPGGGMDHGEELKQALAREIHEETAITQDFRYKLVGVDQLWVASKEAFLLWIVCEVTYAQLPKYGVGADTSAVEFIDPHMFKDSKFRSERMVYKWTCDEGYDARTLDI